MSFLDRIAGSDISAPEAELIRQLGGDPDAIRKRARRQGLMNLGASLLGQHGGSQPARIGRGIAGAAGGMDDEMQRLVSAFNLRTQVGQMHAAEQQKQALSKWVQDDKNFEGLDMPPAVLQFARQQAASGNMAPIESLYKEVAKYRAPVAFAGDAYMKTAAAELGFPVNDASKIPQDAMTKIATRAQELRLQGKKAGAASSTTTVNLPEQENAFQKNLGKQDALQYETWRNDAVAAQEAMASLDHIQQIMEAQKTGKVEQAQAMIGQYFGTGAGANYQEFEAAVGPMVFDLAQKLKPLSNTDIESVKRAMPAFGKDPRANAAILAKLREAAQRQVDLYKSADAHVTKNNSLRGFQIPSYESRADAASTNAPVKTGDPLIDKYLYPDG